jgi:hypothetical protein
MAVGQSFIIHRESVGKPVATVIALAGDPGGEAAGRPLYASIKGAESGTCPADMIEQDVRVELSQPLGERILLDALTGRPVPFGDPKERAPSWT